MELFWLIAGIVFVIWLVSRWKESSTANPDRSSSRQGGNSAREEIVSCPSCGRQNRLREADTQARYRCGSCHRELPNPFTPQPKLEPGQTFRPSATGNSHAKNIAF